MFYCIKHSSLFKIVNYKIMHFIACVHAAKVSRACQAFRKKIAQSGQCYKTFFLIYNETNAQILSSSNEYKKVLRGGSNSN
jgi:hypothetical protein